MVATPDTERRTRTDGAPTAMPPTTPLEAQGDRETRIREAAYRRFEQRARNDGDALTDWLEAEKQVGGRPG